MEVRDRLVAAVLAGGLLLGMVAWQAVGPLLGIAVAVVALALASVIYRVDREGRDGPDEDPPPEVSTRRRAAGRP